MLAYTRDHEMHNFAKSRIRTYPDNSIVRQVTKVTQLSADGRDLLSDVTGCLGCAKSSLEVLERFPKPKHWAGEG